MIMKKNSKKPIGLLILKIILIIGCFIGGVYIGFCKAPNQNLTLKILTDKGPETYTFTNVELYESHKNNTSLSIDLQNEDMQEITEIDIFRYFKSIVVSKINSGNMYMYTTIEENNIIFNSEGVEYLYNISKTCLMERMIFSEIWVSIIIFLWILVNAINEKLDPNNRDNHGPIYEITMFFKNLVKYSQYMTFAAKADLKAEVANSYLNRLWWVLEPFCNMLVYVIIFGKVMGSNIQRYSTFVFSALLMWNFFNHIINYSVKSVRFNKDIVTKIYVPKYVLLITNMILNFIKLLFSMLVLVVMLIFFKVPLTWSMLWIIPVYMFMLLISFSLGMIFLHYGVFIDDLGYAVGILLSLLMFLSGVFYEVVTTIQEPLNHILMCVNPVAIFIDSMRNALLYDSITNVPLIIVWTVLGLLIGYIGIHIVNKNENGYVKVI